MAALTWREVAGPNFGSGNQMFRTGAELQQNALAGIGDAIAKARTEQTDKIDSAILARSLQISDPAAYQKALQDGTLLGGVDPTQLSTKTIGSLGARAGDLISQASTQQAMDTRQYAQNRTVQQDAITDGARGASADQLGIRDPNLRLLSPTEQRALQTGTASLQGQLLGNNARAFSNVTTQRDDAVNQNGTVAADGVRRVSATPLDALAAIEARTDLTPQERSAAVDKLRTDYGSIYADSTGSGGGAAPGGKGGKPGTAAGSPFDTTFNFRGTDKPISSMPINEVLNVQDASRQSEGHSPMGAFQINKATLEDYGPKVLGKDWKTQPFTPENQEKIARALFEDRNGGDLTKTWASLPNSSPGAYKGYDWEQMRSIISKGENGKDLPSDPATLRLLSQQSQFATNRRAAQNDSVGVVADVVKNMADTRSAPEIIQEAIKTQFPDADQGKLLGMVNKIQRNNPGLSAADALSAVSRSTRDASTFNPLTSKFWGTTELGGGVGVDDEVLEANIKSLQTGKADYMSSANQMTRAQGQQVASAQTKFDEAYQNLSQLKQRQNAQPGLSTERAEAALERATQQLQRALSEQNGNQNNQPMRQ